MGGHNTQAVLKFCRDRRGRKVFAINGVPGAKPIWTPKASKSQKGRMTFYNLGVDTAKDTLYGRLSLTRPRLESGAFKEGPAPGYVHLPMSATANYVAQLTAEVVVVRMSNGHPVRKWVLPSGRRNEALDCAVYALAARESFGRHLPRAGSARLAADSPIGNEPEQETAQTAPVRAVPVPLAQESKPQLKHRERPRWGAYR